MVTLINGVRAALYLQVALRYNCLEFK